MSYFILSVKLPKIINVISPKCCFVTYKQTFFVHRSDSIMTDDEFIPFDPPIVSKYGPISRMSKTILRPNSSVQVSASFGDGTISTPMVRRPVPAASPVASWYFNAAQGRKCFYLTKIRGKKINLKSREKKSTEV